MNGNISPAAALPDETPDETLAPEQLETPWLTIGAIAICSIIFVGALLSDGRSVESIPGFEADAGESSVGMLTALLSSVFVHVAIWHFAFNIYWLWHLGRRLEDALGWWRYLCFFLLAAVISSGAQLLLSGTTGIGMSGVLYGMFGFMWIARFRFISFQEILDNDTIGWFLVWLVICIALTALDAINIGNAAHIAGCLFGVAVAYIYRLNGEAKGDGEDTIPAEAA